VAGAGSVSWIFQKKGYIEIDKTVMPDEDKLMGIVLDAGALDMQTEEDVYAITTETKDFESVKKALAASKIKAKSAEVTMLPNNTIKLDTDTAKQVLALVEALEEHDDVQNVYANFDIPDEILS
jgi:transcriptional/translational regulatory protein YebC/TACO1